MNQPAFEDFSSLDHLLDEALALPPERRSRFLAEACADPARRLELERLVALAASTAATGGSFRSGQGLDGAVLERLVQADPFRVGATAGRYRIRGLLGEGGMGRVWRALDPLLGREVAIKVLLDPEPAGGKLRRRLEREARLLAALDHPNIATIHALETIAGAACLILELVEGPTLAQRLSRGPLSMAKVVSLGLQMAEALTAAHRRGIVHRDLKPANIKLCAKGQVKVLDFGIAKPLGQDPRPAGGASVDATTRTGAVLGTAAYMSPEQARGEPVDGRADIWSLGCVLFEMLTGRPLYSGASVAEILAAVLRDEPDLQGLPAQTPLPLRRLLRRCLRRDREERLQDMGDARLELAELTNPAGDEAFTPPPRAGRRRVSRAWGAAIGGVLLAALGLPAATFEPPAPAVAHLSLELPAGLDVANDFACPFALTADGSRLVLVATRAGTSRLYLRRLDGLEVKPISGTEGAWQPFLSPGGDAVAFFADRKLKRVPLSGGPATVLAEVGGNARGGSWSPGGTIVVAASQASGLARIDARGGRLIPLTQLEPARLESSHRWPQVLPGGRWVLFTAATAEGTFDEAHLELVSLETGERRRLLERAAHGRYADGHLFFARGGRLCAAGFDPARLKLLGPPQIVIEGVRHDPRNGGTAFAISESGTLVYAPGLPIPSEHHLAFVDPAGNLRRITESPRRFREPRLSPDGQRVAVRIESDRSADLWVLTTDDAKLSQVSFDLRPHAPTWTPDGRGITIGVERTGRWQLLTLPGDGSASSPKVVLEGANRMYPNAWAPDGSFLVYQELVAPTNWDLRRLDVAPDGKPVGRPRSLTRGDAIERRAAISPDGRFLAFETNQLDGMMAIHLAPLSDFSATVRASRLPGNWPRWDAAGRLYFWYPQRARPGDERVAGLYRMAPREAGSVLVPGASSPLWAELGSLPQLLTRVVVAPHAGFDLDASGPTPRFLVLEADLEGVKAPASLERPVVALNWTATLAAR